MCSSWAQLAKCLCTKDTAKQDVKYCSIAQESSLCNLTQNLWDCLSLLGKPKQLCLGLLDSQFTDYSFNNHEYYRDQSHTLALQSRVWDCCVTAGLIFKAFWLFRSQKYARTAQITWMCKFLIKLTAHCSLMFCLRLKLPAYFKLGKIRIILIIWLIFIWIILIIWLIFTLA